MQLITSKILPPISPSLSTLIAKSHGDGKRGFTLQLGLKYCPTMDLVATYPILAEEGEVARHSNDDKQTEVDQADAFVDLDDGAISVDVWRLNGQKVFEVNVENDEGVGVDVIDVDWRDDGQILAVLSSDNIIRLVNSFNGKTVHRFSSLSAYTDPHSPRSSFNITQKSTHASKKAQSAASGTRSAILSYSAHFSDPTSTSTQLLSASRENGTSLDDLLGLNADLGKLLKSKADLPRELASIDVEAFLPKLACLPPAGFGADDLFSTRTSVDAIFHSSKRSLRSGTVDLLVTGNNDGTVHLRIFDSFEVGDINLTTAMGLPRGSSCGKVIKIANHAFSNETFILTEIRQPKADSGLNLLCLDLKNITHSTTALPVLATKATQLSNLLRYLGQIHTQLAREVKTALDLPSRFLRNLNEDLVNQDGDGSSFSTAAYHAIITGEVSGALKEWLAEQLGERGAKRWEKAVGDCLELVRRLISESWNPAVERLGVVASRLSGLAGWQAYCTTDGEGFGIDKKLMNGLEQTLDVMAVCGEELLRDVNHELANFTSFIKWLKWEVEAASLEDTSERLDEMRESSDHGEVLKVLEYIDKGVADTVVKRYLADVPKQENSSTEEDQSFYTRFKEGRKVAHGHDNVPTFAQLLSRIQRQCEALFEQIAYSLRSSITVAHVTRLSPSLDQAIMDIRVVPEPEYGSPKLHVISQSTEANGLILYTVVDTGIRLSREVKGTGSILEQLTAPDVEAVLDVKFVDEDGFMILAETADDTVIYAHGLFRDGEPGYDWELRHTFPQGLMESGMKASRIEVNGRKGRKAVAVIDREGKGYSVFDLDSGDGDETGSTDHSDQVMTG